MSSDISVGHGCALCVTDGEVNGKPFLVCTEKCTAPIRALTVLQPYAWAITVGVKPVENRTRRTKYRGLLAIHAGKRVMREGLGDPRILEAIADRDFEINEATSRLGCVVAVADLTGCHDATYTAGCSCSPWAASYSWHWELSDVRPLREPVPCRGMLGLWRLPLNVEAKVRRQLEEP